MANRSIPRDSAGAAKAVPYDTLQDTSFRPASASSKRCWPSSRPMRSTTSPHFGSAGDRLRLPLSPAPSSKAALSVGLARIQILQSSAGLDKTPPLQTIDRIFNSEYGAQHGVDVLQVISPTGTPSSFRREPDTSASLPARPLWR